jgi:hypothetical protein
MLRYNPRGMLAIVQIIDLKEPELSKKTNDRLSSCTNQTALTRYFGKRECML